jgi:hypothetical protein
MSIRAGAAFLVFASLIVVVPMAGAAPPCIIDFGLVDFAPPLEETAEVILVFRPSVDYPMVSGVETVLQGEIERVEKGVLPQTIVITAGTLWAGLRAGVPARLYLVKFRTRDPHYIIGVGAPNRPRNVSINVSVSGTYRVTTTGSTILIEGLVTARFDSLQDSPMDVYVWLVRPNGDPVWVTGNVFMPTMTASATPIPFLVRAPQKTIGFGVTYRFAPDDPPGWYQLNGVVVFPRPGADPRDPCDWLDTSTFPLLVIKAETP